MPTQTATAGGRGPTAESLPDSTETFDHLSFIQGAIASTLHIRPNGLKRGKVIF